MQQRAHSAGQGFEWLAPLADPLLRWAAALALFLVTLALRLAAPTSGCAYPFLAFFPAVLLSAWIAGAPAAAAVTAASAAASWWFLIRSPGALRWPDAGEAAALAGFVAVGGLAIALVVALRRAAVRARAAQASAQRVLAGQRTMAVELQHRVANNLQLMSSILSLQRRALSGTPAAAEALDGAMRRLDALGRLHRLLLTKGDSGDAALVLEELCRTQMEVGGRDRVSLETRLDGGIRLDAGRLTMLGMIVSEALSNSLKYGFAEDGTGRIAIRLRRAAGDRVELEVRDDGAGLPPGFDPTIAATLGLRIMRSLAQGLGGELSLGDERGTVLRLGFPVADADPAA